MAEFANQAQAAFRARPSEPTLMRAIEKETASVGDRIFDDKGLSAFYHAEYQQQIAAKTLRKKRCVGGGPPFFKGFGGRAYYRERPARDWIEAQFSPEVRSTSELPKRAA